MQASYSAQQTLKIPWQISFGNLVLFIYACTSALYIFPSGFPQPADFILLVGIVVNLSVFMLQPSSKFDRAFLFAIGFAALAFIINITNFLFDPDLTFIKSSLYYIYNASAFILVVSLFRAAPNQTWKALYYGLVVSVILELIVVQFFPNFRGPRQIGTFINPNQLAIWSLIMASTLIVLKSKIKLSLFDLCLLLGLGYIQALSLSKAGIICFGILSTSLLFLPALSASKRALLFVLCMITVIFGVFGNTKAEVITGNFEIIEKVISRLETIGMERDDSLEGRNYDRIFEHPEYILLGAGEGGYLRFEENKSMELHSGIGTIIFSYGIFGLFLFMGLIFCTLYRNSALVFILVATLFLNGLVHQNVRFRYFWIFLAVCYVSREINFKTATQQRMKNAPAYLPETGLAKT